MTEIDSETRGISAVELTRRSRSNFALSFAFLSKPRRRGIAAIYAFCRAADDAVDETDTADDAIRLLKFWRQELSVAAGEKPGVAQSEIGRDLAQTIDAFAVPAKHLHAVLDGCERDLAGATYADLEATEGYCALVASAVGLACLPVFGVSEARAGRYADRLGKALQWTNILRDLREDAKIGRYYVPAECLLRHRVEPSWLAGEGPDAAYADGGAIDGLVRELAVVAHQHFDEAARELDQLASERRRLLAAEVMGAVYAEVLRLVEQRRGRIRSDERLRIPKPRKLMLAARTWIAGRRP